MSNRPREREALQIFHCAFLSCKNGYCIAWFSATALRELGETSKSEFFCEEEEGEGVSDTRGASHQDIHDPDPPVHIKAHIRTPEPLAAWKYM